MVTLLVRDYDEALAWFGDKLGFEMLEDTRLSDDKRWVRMGTTTSGGARILLAKSSDERQAQRVGDSLGGRVGFFLETDDFDRDHAAYRERGVVFEEAPREESYGKVAVFRDLYGNRWDLIEPR